MSTLEGPGRFVFTDRLSSARPKIASHDTDVPQKIRKMYAGCIKSKAPIRGALLSRGLPRRSRSYLGLTRKRRLCCRIYRWPHCQHFNSCHLRAADKSLSPCIYKTICLYISMSKIVQCHHGTVNFPPWKSSSALALLGMAITCHFRAYNCKKTVRPREWNW